jgi:hypothetical protein
MGEGAIVRPVEAASRSGESRFERQPLAQHRVEQAKGCPPRSGADRLGRGQRLDPNGSSALLRRLRLDGTAVLGAPARPNDKAICSSAAIRLPVSG